MNVLLFDDHQIILDGLHNFFSTKKEITQINTTISSKEAIELLKSNNFDYFISDVLTNDDIGLTLFENLIAEKIDVKTIVYTSITSELIIETLLEMGVKEVVNKSDTPDKIWDAMMIYEKEIVVYPKVYELLPTLTQKEKDIIKFLLMGKTAKEIAIFTDSSINTINNQKSNLLSKFEVENITKLIYKLIQSGYISI